MISDIIESIRHFLITTSQSPEQTLKTIILGIDVAFEQDFKQSLYDDPWTLTSEPTNLYQEYFSGFIDDDSVPLTSSTMKPDFLDDDPDESLEDFEDMISVCEESDTAR